MTVSVLQGAAAGAILTGAVVAFVVHPAALTPHPSSTPTLTLASPADPPPPRERAGAAAPVVDVAGAVARPGVYALAPQARAIDAVTKAGGFTHDADTVAVNLAAHVADGDEIVVPRIGDPAPEASTSAHHRSRHRATKRSHRGRHRRSSEGSETTAEGEAPSQSIDLNTADAETLATIPGVGPTLADRIVEFRELNGPFPSVDALADVSGISASRFDAIAAYLTVERP
jgi:competence protein ComEA